MTQLTAALLSLSGAVAYLVLGGLAFAEAAVFVGVVFPGETALLLGGVLAQQDRVSLPVMLVVAALAAVVGDSVGYQVGRAFGPVLRQGWLGLRIGQRRWDAAERFVARHGGTAVFLGRWTALMRALVPCLAGMSRMPYPRFLLFNATGGALWASAVVCAGYGAGASYERVQHVLGRGSLVLLGLVATVAAVALAARWVSRHPARVVDAVRRVAGTHVVAWLVCRVVALAGHLGARRATVVNLGLGLAAAIGLATGFAAVAENVLEGDGIARLDHPVLGWLAGHRYGALTDTALMVTNFADALLLAAFCVVAVVVAVVGLRRLWPLVLTGVALPGAGLIVVVTKAVVGRQRPPLPMELVPENGASFPSGHTLGATVAYGVFAYLAICAVRSWHARVWIITAAAAAAGVIGFTRLYLGVHWLTDVVASWLLGGAWLALCVTTCQLLLRRRAERSPDKPPGGDDAMEPSAQLSMQ